MNLQALKRSTNFIVEYVWILGHWILPEEIKPFLLAVLTLFPEAFRQLSQF